MHHSISSSITKYADDTKLYRIISTPSDHTILQNDIITFNNWVVSNNLVLNVDKTHYICITNNNTCIRQYHILNNPIQKINSTKDLGVTIVQNLSVSTHCSNTRTKALRSLGFIRRHINPYTNAHLFIKLYKSSIRPILDYASTAWSPWLKKDIDTIEYTQRLATRLCDPSGSLSYQDRCSMLKLSSLQDRRNRYIVFWYYRILTTPNHPLLPLLKLSANNYTRGHHLKLEVTYCHYNLTKALFAHSCVNLWNSLPDSVVASDSFAIFKKTFDTWLESFAASN